MQNLEYSSLDVEILEMIQRMLSRLGIGSEIEDNKIGKCTGVFSSFPSLTTMLM